MLLEFFSKYILTNEFASASLGGFFTLAGVRYTYRMQSRREDHQERGNQIQQIKLLISEINILFEIFDGELGRDLENHDIKEPFWETLPIGENVFVFFDSSPQCLSAMGHDTAAKTLRWYARAKGYVELIKINNRDIESALSYARSRQDELHDSRRQITSASIFTATEDSKKQVHQSLIQDYARRHGMASNSEAMKMMYFEMKELTTLVSSMLIKEIAILRKDSFFQRITKQTI